MKEGKRGRGEKDEQEIDWRIWKRDEGGKGIREMRGRNINKTSVGHICIKKELSNTIHKGIII